jgi:hypothetical protein
MRVSAKEFNGWMKVSINKEKERFKQEKNKASVPALHNQLA